MLLPQTYLHKHSLSIPQKGVGQMEQPDQGMVGEFPVKQQETTNILVKCQNFDRFFHVYPYLLKL